LLKTCGASKEAISLSFKKVGHLFSKKNKNKELTKDDINELRETLTRERKRPEIAASLAALPAEIEIPDSTETNPDKSKGSTFKFGGFKGKKFESDIIDMGEGIHFHMPKKFKTKFESTPCDLTAERERLQKEARKKAEAEQKEREKAAREAQKAEKERTEREASEKAHEEIKRQTEERRQRKAELAKLNEAEKAQMKAIKREKERLAHKEREAREAREAERIAKEREELNERERQEKK